MFMAINSASALVGYGGHELMLARMSRARNMCAVAGCGRAKMSTGDAGIAG
jgi:hypothetical protein